jgi:nicotinate-nucleotide--dimethylbenzimidazole phosphoribosyltransferase
VSVLLELGTDVEWPDEESAADARARASGCGLGELAALAEWLAGAQAACPPRRPERVRLIRFGTASAVDEPSAFSDVAVRDEQVTDDGAESSIRHGAQIADDEIDRGADLLVVTVPDARRSAAVLVAVLTDTEPIKVLPRGTALGPAEWMSEAEAIRDARRAAFGLRGEPVALLDAVRAPAIAAAIGFLLRAAARRTPVLYDGPGAAAAALIGFDAQARAAQWWRPADSAGHPAQDVALTRMGQQPVLTLGTSMDDGTAGALAATVVRAAADVLADRSG